MATPTPVRASIPLPPWQLSSSHSHSLTPPQIRPFLRLHSRFDVFHAVRTRNNINFDPWRFGEEEEDDDDAEFVRRRGRRRRGRGGRRSRRQRWWSDDEQVEDGQEVGILEQAVDNLWILKVFKSYGLFLPVILISLLLATGPKAFLMGSGVPFGLSLLAFAIKKLLQLLDFNPNPNPRPRPRRPRFDGQNQEAQQGKRSKTRSYQTEVNSFGGWDELVTEDETKSTERRSSGTKAWLEKITGKKLGMEEIDMH